MTLTDLRSSGYSRKGWILVSNPLEPNIQSSELNGQYISPNKIIGRVSEDSTIEGDLSDSGLLAGQIDTDSIIEGNVSSTGGLAGQIATNSIINGGLSSTGALAGRVTIGSIIEGVSPVVSIIQIEGGYELTIVDINGPKTVRILNGVDGEDGPQGEVDEVLVAELVDGYLTENPPVAQVHNVVEF